LTSVNPDIASGVAVASCCDSYWTSRLPMSIAGLSSHSNGLQHLHGDGKGDSAKDFWKLMEVSAVRWQQSVPRVIGSLAMGISDSLVGASRAGLLNKAVGLDSRGMILACIREMSGKKPDCFADTVETVRGVLQRDRPEEIAWFEGVVREFAPMKSSAMSSHGSRESELHLNLGIDRGVMRQRLVDLRVSNCAEAAEWFEQTFRCAECPREWNIVPLGAHPTTDRRSALMRGLNRLRRAGRVLLTGR
jgi:hypothetical protein